MTSYDAGFTPIGLRATWKGNLSLLVVVALMASSIIFVCVADSNSSPPSHGIFRHDVSQNFARKTPKEKKSASVKATPIRTRSQIACRQCLMCARWDTARNDLKDSIAREIDATQNID